MAKKVPKIIDKDAVICGSTQKKYGNITVSAGMIYGNWITVDDNVYSDGELKLKVKCSFCNAETFRSLSALQKGYTRQCKGCRKYNQANPDPSWPGKKGIPSSYYSRTKEGARQRNLTFEVSKDELYQKYMTQSGTCALSGVPISFTAKNASLDRIDSSIGYTTSNVQWVHKDINRLKNSFPQDYFIGMCNSVATYSPTPTKNIFEKLGMKPAENISNVQNNHHNND